MKNKRFLAMEPGWVVVVLLTATLGMSMAMTQTVAFRFHFSIDEYRMDGRWYWPWAGWIWYAKHRHQAPHIFRDGWVMALGAGMVLLVLPLWFANRRRRGDDLDGLHGTADFANKKEVEAMGLFENKLGVHLGGFGSEKKPKYLIHNGPEHVAVIAPTRSGKGIGVVIPTLAGSWRESCVVLDIKGENYALSAGVRRNAFGNKVVFFDPTYAAPKGQARDGSAARYNPLLEVEFDEEHPEGGNTVRDVQNIAGIIVRPDDAKTDSHWEKSARSLLTGLIMYHLVDKRSKGEIPTLAGVDALLAQAGNAPPNDESKKAKDARHEAGDFSVWERMLEMGEERGIEVIKKTALDMGKKPGDERGSIISTALSYFSLFRDPRVAANTECSDFKIKDLVKGWGLAEKPLSLFIIIRPSDIKRLMPLVRIFITQICQQLCMDMAFKNGKQVQSNKHRLLLLLDEFPSIGQVPIIEESLAYMAGYGIKCVLIMQDLTQLYKCYTKEQSIMGNCHIRIAYAPNNPDTAKTLSGMAGEKTVVSRKVSNSGGGLGKGGGWNESFDATKRPLMTPDEIMRMPGLQKNREGKVVSPGRVLMFIAGQPLILGVQTPWFFDKKLAAAVEANADEAVAEEPVGAMLEDAR